MFYDFVCAAVKIILAAFTRIHIEGLENVPRSGSFLMVSNHLNLIDPPVLGALLRRRIAFMAKEELFRTPVVGWVVKGYGAFSVRRGQADRQALRTAVTVLKQGGAIGIFPEGHRSETGKMIEAHPGAALIALTSAAPVLPVGIWGTDRVRSPLSLLLRPRIDIRIGEPFMLQRSASGKEDLGQATRTMMARVARLIPDDRRGYYADAVDENLEH